MTIFSVICKILSVSIHCFKSLCLSVIRNSNGVAGSKISLIIYFCSWSHIGGYNVLLVWWLCLFSAQVVLPGPGDLYSGLQDVAQETQGNKSLRLASIMLDSLFIHMVAEAYIWVRKYYTPRPPPDWYLIIEPQAPFTPFFLPLLHYFTLLSSIFPLSLLFLPSLSHFPPFFSSLLPSPFLLRCHRYLPVLGWAGGYFLIYSSHHDRITARKGPLDLFPVLVV
jgi:hypothetical protein